MKLLLVEDDKFFAQRISEYLSDNGFESVTVQTTHDAIGKPLDEFTGAIIDVMLPNDPVVSGISSEETRGGYLAGVALARRFRQKNPKFPIVLLSSGIIGGEANRWAKENSVPFVFKHEDRGRLLSALSDLGIVQHIKRPRAFIVHGHDEPALAELKDYLQNTLKWPEPVVLREQPNCGKTMIEKFEEQAGLVDWVFVLISPDDKIFDPHTDDEKRRARQNVIFELGFFYGLLGRYEGRVIVLKKGQVELPSDIHGVVWINIDKGIRASGEDIRKELGL
jgi:CheY-like chemotaxis protein